MDLIDEAIDMIQAMATGHAGTLGILHGNSPAEVISRLERRGLRLVAAKFMQVSRELAWLYGKAGGRIATCVGGMNPSLERRALQSAERDRADVAQLPRQLLAHQAGAERQHGHAGAGLAPASRRRGRCWT